MTPFDLPLAMPLLPTTIALAKIIEDLVIAVGYVTTVFPSNIREGSKFAVVVEVKQKFHGEPGRIGAAFTHLTEALIWP